MVFWPADDWAEVPFDPAVVDPADPADDYVDRLQAAIDRAGGRGFRTEYAGWIADLPLGRAPARRSAAGGTSRDCAPGKGAVSNMIDLRSGTTSRAALLLAPLLVALAALIRRWR